MAEPRVTREEAADFCWCWQYGRCLVPADCLTANYPRPVPLTNEHWYRAWLRVKEASRG